MLRPSIEQGIRVQCSTHWRVSVTRGLMDPESLVANPLGSDASTDPDTRGDGDVLSPPGLPRLGAALSTPEGEPTKLACAIYSLLLSIPWLFFSFGTSNIYTACPRRWPALATRRPSRGSA